MTVKNKVYIKKPVKITAVLFEKSEDAEDIVGWINSFPDSFSWRSVDTRISIETLEGTVYASVGDYIIQGVEGEFYPCKPGIFKKTYYDPNQAPDYFPTDNPLFPWGYTVETPTGVRIGMIPVS